MDPKLAAEIGAIAKLNRRQIYHIFSSESPRQYRLTKALLDILHNLCIVESIETGDGQKIVLEKHLKVIRPLLSVKTTLKTKKNLLQTNVALVLALAETCLLQNA